MTVVLDKSKVYTKRYKQKHLLYNYVVNVLLDRIINKKIFSSDIAIQFIASKRETNKYLNNNFTQYLKNNLTPHPYYIDISIKTPTQEK